MVKKLTRAERKEQAIKKAAEALASVPFPSTALNHILTAVECFPYFATRSQQEVKRAEWVARVTEHSRELEQILAYVLAGIAHEREIAAEEQRRDIGLIEVESCTGIDRTEVLAMLNGVTEEMEELKGESENVR